MVQVPGKGNGKRKRKSDEPTEEVIQSYTHTAIGISDVVPRGTKCGRCATTRDVVAYQLRCNPVEKTGKSARKKAKVGSSVVYACPSCFIDGYDAGGFASMGMSFEAWACKCAVDKVFDGKMEVAIKIRKGAMPRLFTDMGVSTGDCFEASTIYNLAFIPDENFSEAVQTPLGAEARREAKKAGDIWPDAFGKDTTGTFAAHPTKPYWDVELRNKKTFRRDEMHLIPGMSTHESQGEQISDHFLKLWRKGMPVPLRGNVTVPTIESLKNECDAVLRSRGEGVDLAQLAEEEELPSPSVDGSGSSHGGDPEEEEEEALSAADVHSTNRASPAKTTRTSRSADVAAGIKAPGTPVPKPLTQRNLERHDSVGESSPKRNTTQDSNAANSRKKFSRNTLRSGSAMSVCSCLRSCASRKRSLAL